MSDDTQQTPDGEIDTEAHNRIRRSMRTMSPNARLYYFLLMEDGYCLECGHEDGECLCDKPEIY